MSVRKISLHRHPNQLAKDKRNAMVIEMWQQKKRKSEIARKMNLSFARISYIIRHHEFAQKYYK